MYLLYQCSVGLVKVKHNVGIVYVRQMFADEFVFQCPKAGVDLAVTSLRGMAVQSTALWNSCTTS